MYYTTIIDNPEEGLDTILEAASKFDTDRFLYALNYKNWDEKRFEKMANEVAFYRKRLETEYKRLVDFAQVFNKEFATMDNNRYNSAMTLLSKLRSGISETKKIFTRFCPRARKENFYHAIGNKTVSAFEYSYISSDTYQLKLFAFEGYPDYVNILCNEMETFFLVLIRCMQLCKQVLKDEKIIRSDNKYCKLLYDEFKEKVWLEFAGITSVFHREDKCFSEEGNPAIASRNRYENDEAWAPEGFHKFSIPEVKLLAIKQMLDEEDGSDLTRREISLFGNDEKKVQKYRLIIKNFDMLIPDNYRRQNLPAKYIKMFFRYIGIKPGLEKEAVAYFNEMYLSSPNHKFATVTYPAVNGYTKEVEVDKDGAYKTFTESLKQHFFNTVPLQKAANF